MLIQKEDYLGFLKATGIIERNYSFDAKSFQITLNINLYSCFSILEDLLKVEKSSKIQRLGRIIILSVKHLLMQ